MKKHAANAKGNLFELVELDQQNISDEASGRISLAQKRILSVEDDHVNTLLISKLAGLRGWNLDYVEDGMAALAYFEKTHYDLVLMDLQMPVMDGLSCAKKMRAFEKKQKKSGHTPIIAITAHAFDAHWALCQEAGMDGILTKPLDLRELIALVERYLMGT